MLSGKRQDFSPLTLQGRDVLQFRQLDRSFITERHMGAQEVVVSDDQRSKGDGSVRAVKAVRRFHVEFISSVKALNELFKGSELLGLFIEILKANDLMMLDVG